MQFQIWRFLLHRPLPGETVPVHIHGERQGAKSGDFPPPPPQFRDLTCMHTWITIPYGKCETQTGFLQLECGGGHGGRPRGLCPLPAPCRPPPFLERCMQTFTPFPFPLFFLPSSPTFLLPCPPLLYDIDRLFTFCIKHKRANRLS